MLNLVLLEPEIPQNTGNIARTCAVTGARLHLIEPLGFSLEGKYVRRAGMDYWNHLDVTVYKNWQDFLLRNNGASLWFVTTKGRKVYSEVAYPEDSFLVFGKESAGIPEEILVEHPEQCIRIPMRSESRSLNLSNTAAILAYEVLRQRNFTGLKKSGELHRLSWKD